MSYQVLAADPKTRVAPLISQPSIQDAWMLEETSGVRAIFCPTFEGISCKGEEEPRKKVGSDRSSFFLNEIAPQVEYGGDNGAPLEGGRTVHAGSKSSWINWVRAVVASTLLGNNKSIDKYYFLHPQMDNEREVNTKYEDLMDTTEGEKYRIRKQEACTPSPNSGAKLNATPTKKKKKRTKAFSSHSFGAVLIGDPKSREGWIFWDNSGTGERIGCPFSGEC